MYNINEFLAELQNGVSPETIAEKFTTTLNEAIAQAKAAEEAELKRKVECEDLIQEAIRLKNNGEYNSAKKKLDKARKMKIAEKEEAISTLEKEVLKLKSENSFWGNISKKVNEVVGKVLDEE
jgi:hypothetical protein